jgi:uncharacterized protein (TIGR02328 family)
MRLWHPDIIKYLPNKQVLGQHRECCALRGLGWGKKHQVVDYVFKHSPNKLYWYHHSLILFHMAINRGFTIDDTWRNPFYRGKKSPEWDRNFFDYEKGNVAYNEHDDLYLLENILNLNKKGVFLTEEKTSISDFALVKLDTMLFKHVKHFFKQHENIITEYNITDLKDLKNVQYKFYNWS